MGRIVAIDYGTKRVGVAASDELQIIACSLGTVHSSEIIGFLKKYSSTENIESFVVGEPKQMNNSVSESEKFIKSFIKKLTVEFPNTPVERYDERFTSKIAGQTMIDAGLNKKQRKNKEMLDSISATLILQSFMEFKNNKR
jgi:putative Holliday junction resolvase